MKAIVPFGRAKWKLVALRGEPWELYNITTDRMELDDLSSKHQRRVRRMAKSWEQWAAQNQVTPLPKDYGVEYVPARSEAPGSDK